VHNTAVVQRLINATTLLCLMSLGCGTDAEREFAGTSSLIVGQPDGIGYRLRYLEPPWERASADPLEQGAADARVQYGDLDGRSTGSLFDLTPSAGSARVLVIEKSAEVRATPAGVLTYPKYRLEVAVLRCAELGIQVAQQDSCAKHLNTSDATGRGPSELPLFGQDGRMGQNSRGQPYYEFMTQVNETQRYRRVVYFETGDRLTAIRLGFEANPPLSELEVTNMIDSFEVLDGEFAAATGADGGDSTGLDGGAP
jgi:hypothetical protein